MTDIEQAAINLHDHIWLNAGTSDEWPLCLSGDDAEVTELIRLLNVLQGEIVKSGYDHTEYSLM